MKIESVPNVSSIQPKGISSEKPVVSIEQASVASDPRPDFKVDYNSSSGNGEEKEIINDEMIDRAIKMANQTLKQHNSVIERSVHEVTKTVMYVMRDTETNEVIKEFPPKKIQDMIAKMWELAGLFVDEKA